MFKPGTKVKTPDGAGVVVRHEEDECYPGGRFDVKMDNPGWRQQLRNIKGDRWKRKTNAYRASNVTPL